MNKMVKRILTVILATACVITALPWAAYEVYAEEIETALLSETEEEVLLDEELPVVEESVEEIAEEFEEVVDTTEDTDDSVELQSVESKCGDNLYYRISNNGCDLTIFGTGAMWDNYEFPIIAISVENLYINSGITEIGNKAFIGFKKLTSVTIPNTVTRIGKKAFGSCTFEAITIPESVERIEEGAFAGCESLKSIVIPASVTYLGSNAFSLDYALESVKVLGNITEIPDSAFESCKALNTVEIPDSVTSIGRMAFCGCEKLEEITFPEDLEIIGESAFERSGLVNLDDLGKVTVIGNYAFKNCKSLATVALPDSLTKIGNQAFTYTAITSVLIPNKVTEVGDGAFSRCEYLDTLNDTTETPWKMLQPAGDPVDVEKITLEEINDENCKGFVKDPASAEPSYKCGDNLTYSFDKTTGTLTISGTGPMWDNMKVVGWKTGTDDVKEIVIGDEVTSIGKSAFSGIRFKYNSITIPKSVTEIGEGAFGYVSDLQTVTFEEGSKITQIKDYTFVQCESLSSINIPDTVTEICYNAFDDCAAFESITLPENLASIGGCAFYGCSSLESVSIPDSVETIGSMAFYDCSNLKSVEIGVSVHYIGEYAFKKCNLQSITIPDGVAILGYSAFSGNERLKTGSVNFGTGWYTENGVSYDINEKIKTESYHPYLFRNKFNVKVDSNEKTVSAYNVSANTDLPDVFAYIGTIPGQEKYVISEEVTEKSPFTFYVDTMLGYVVK